MMGQVGTPHALSSEGLYPQKRELDVSVRRLAAGILLQALRDAALLPRNLNGQEEELRREAIEWFFSPSTRPGSFHWVCFLIQQDPRLYREWLRRYIEGDRKRRREMRSRLSRVRIPRFAELQRSGNGRT